MLCGISKIAAMYYPSLSQSSTCLQQKVLAILPSISCNKKEGLHCSYDVLSTLQTPTIAQQ
jgi:hypothetical protein